jgi:hypothetical protein
MPRQHCARDDRLIDSVLDLARLHNGQTQIAKQRHAATTSHRRPDRASGVHHR